MLNSQSAADAGLTGMPTSPLSLDGRIVGTVAYMAPEQAEGKLVDQRSDIFSVGALLHEMATGKRAFKGETTIALLSSVLRDDPPAVNELNPRMPKAFGRIVTQCLEKDPQRRYETAVELRADIERIQQGDVDHVSVAEHEKATIVFAIDVFRRVLDQARAVARTSAAVLIHGG